jgi:hypothetical protein
MISATCLSGFAALRTRPGKPTQVTREVRRCTECGTRIARLHEGTLCYRCEDAQRWAEVDREIAEGKLTLSYGPRVQYDLDGVPSLTVPLVGTLADWNALIDAFLDSPHQTAHGEGRPSKTAQQSIQTAVRRRGLAGEVWAVVRDQQCYLMRKEGQGESCPQSPGGPLLR